jgi:uncharacterized protein
VAGTDESLATARMMPTVSDLNRPFWTGGATGALLIQHCDTCERWIHPQVASCPTCGGEPVARPTSGLGSTFTFTVNRHPYNPAVPLPYVIAIVELDEQTDLRLMTNIVNCDPEDVLIGMPVRVVFEQHDDLFIPLFEPDRRFDIPLTLVP